MNKCVAGIVFASIIAGACRTVACGQGEPDDLVGKWVVVTMAGHSLADMEARWRPSFVLSLNSDGTFTEHREMHFMTTYIADSKGTYKRDSQAVRLDGMSTTFVDDGYAKNTDMEHVHRSLRFDGEQLSDPDEKLVYVREGAPARPKPKPPAARRKIVFNPAAVRLLQTVERTYASIRSYRDEGTLESSGEGFEFKHARFATRFFRPGKFYFCVQGLEQGKVYEQNAVWSAGGKAWLYEGMDRPDSAFGGGDVASDLGNMSPESGGETLLVPFLLMPTLRGAEPLSESYPEISLGPDEPVAGVAARIVKLSGPGKLTLTLWIGKKSHLILKVYEAFSKGTIVYRPQVNVKFGPGDFTFKIPRYARP